MKSTAWMKSKTALSVGSGGMKSQRIGMKSRCDEVRYADEVENLRFQLGLNPFIAEATSSE